MAHYQVSEQYPMPQTSAPPVYPNIYQPVPIIIQAPVMASQPAPYYNVEFSGSSVHMTCE